MMHHPGQWPCGTIGPVHALLLPPQHVNEAALLPPAGGQASSAAPVQLWLWLHPAAYHEGLAALQRLCQPSDAVQQQRPQDVTPAGVTITPMSRHLRRLELRGPSSIWLLAALLPAAKTLASPPAPAGMALTKYCLLLRLSMQPEPHIFRLHANVLFVCRHSPGVPGPGPSAGPSAGQLRGRR